MEQVLAPYIIVCANILPPLTLSLPFSNVTPIGIVLTIWM